MAAKSQWVRARADARQRILNAAEALFSERSFDTVSMNTVAVRARVSKANIFHHFGSKNALYLTVLRAACRHSADLLQDLVQESGPLAERLRRFAQKHLDHILEQEALSRLMMRELLKGNPRRGQEFAQQVFGENFTRFVEILRRGQEEGVLRADIDPAIVATLIIGANVFFFQGRDVLRHFPEVKFADQPAQYSRMMVDIILHGISTNAGRPS